MVTNSRELSEQALDPDRVRTSPDLGPSDSTDSASDMPGNAIHSDSDAANTGERPAVENTRDVTADDIEPDYVVDRDGVASPTKES